MREPAGVRRPRRLVLQCSQLAKQRAGPVQVWGVKALSEPVIDRREHIQSLLAG